MELKFILEALLFSAQKPINPRELRELLTAAATGEGATDASRAWRNCNDAEIEAALTELAQDHAAAQRSYRLVCVAGAWQFVTQPDYAPWLRALVGQRLRPPRLSQPALETLAIIAYRQPITRAAIEQVRGVNVDGVMQTLLERGLVQGVGRAQVVGHPMNYGTTALFLEYFGLRSLDDLPAADELRRVPLTKPSSPGLATPPPEDLNTEVESQSAEATAVGPPPAPANLPAAGDAAGSGR